ncbi:MAG TPA: DUF2892 domain-containing protein [Telluria sp.]|jgi:hypothetical protein
MFYSKNVPAWERVLRILFALMALGFAAFSWGTPLAVVAGLSGVMLAATGLFGFCPMCALVGRKLDKGA